MLRLIESLAGLRSRGAPAGADLRRFTATGAPVRAAGHLTLRYAELAAFEALEINVEADCLWRPGPPSARVRAPASFFKALRLEIAGRRLVISASGPLLGARPIFELSSARLMEAHVSGSARLEAEDLEAGRLIATARGQGFISLCGEAAEAHFETMDEGVIDAASLSTFIAAAELSGRGMVLLRAREAIDADLHDDSQLLTIGSPALLAARRHPPKAAAEPEDPPGRA